MIKTVKVKTDEYTEKIAKCFDYEFDGTSTFEVPEIDLNQIPEDYNIGLIVGPSGSGKTSLLSLFGNIEEVTWDNSISIASNFSSPEEAIDKLGAVGLSSIPTWCKPYNVLSNGEAFRADLARRLKDNAIIDEFTSVVNRECAKACSASISKYIRKNNIKNVVIASCHRDIIEWLEPDWVYDTGNHELSVGRNLWHRPEIVIEIRECKKDLWEMFKEHHYLNNTMNSSCRCFVALWGEEIVGFVGAISLPGKIPPLYEGDERKKWRESRAVILPDYQGIGIGTRLSEAVGQIFLDQGYRYFSKTAHIRVGEHRQHSDLWRPTSTNLKSREKSREYGIKEGWSHIHLDVHRLCFSHEYIGPKGTKYRDLYEEQKRKDKEAKRLEGQKKLFIKNKKKIIDKK